MLQKNCPILLLDEPTAQVDFKSQKMVLDNLFALCKQRNVTVLMIAHRLETAITYSDKVLVMDQGSVVEFDHSWVLLSEDVDGVGDESSPSRDSFFASMVSSLTQ